MQIHSIARSIVLFWLFCHHRTTSFTVPRGNDYHRASTSNTGEVITTSSKEAPNPEPSCEELKQMWRFSKRQSRAAEITNEIPTYRDPFSLNVWEPYAAARSRSIGGMRVGYAKNDPVYGELRHTPPYLRIQDVAARNRAFEEVAKLYGSDRRNKARVRQTAFRFTGGDRMYPMGIAPQSGSFQRLKELIRTERARELRDQRRAEEAAARNEALKELARSNHRAQFTNYRDNYDYETENKPEEPDVVHESKAMIQFPNVYAPAAARFEPGPNEANLIENYSYFRDRPRNQRSYFQPSSYDNNMDGLEGLVL